VDPAATDAAGWTAGDDAPGRCPIETVQVMGTDRAELDERAKRIADTVAPQRK
jgi:hypothetical protein